MVSKVIGFAVAGSPVAEGIVVGVVLVAAVSHAGWNLLAKAMHDQVVAFWLINLASAVCGAGILAAVGGPA